MTHRSADNTGAQRVALFAGSFNPFTVGHDSIVRRGLGLFDRIIVGVGHNRAKTGDDVAARVDAIKKIYAGIDAVEVRPYSCLTVDFARECGAGYLLRGMRSVKDFEYERDMADINRRLTGIETVILFTLPEHAAISSSIVRELQSYGHDVNSFLP